MKQFQYLTLRYVHDAVTGEFANVGVVVYSRGDFLGGRFNSRIGRLSAFFGHVEKFHLKSLLKHLERKVEALAQELNDPFGIKAGSLEEILQSLLPHDSSSLRWDTIRKGLTLDPSAELEKIYSRVVTQYDERPPTRHRSDGDVWKSFSSALKEKQVLEKLVPKEIKTKDLVLSFDHAWKNGVWNLLEPLALDFEDIDSILDKGNRWLGRGVALNESSDAHKFWFLVGDLEDPKHAKAAERALNLLRKIGPNKVEIIRESERDQFSERLAEEIRVHGEEK